MSNSPFKKSDWKKPKETLKRFRKCRSKNKKNTNPIPANQSTLSSFITKKNVNVSFLKLFVFKFVLKYALWCVYDLFKNL